METLEIQTKLQISKPATEIFEAIVDPLKMSGYFIDESTGRMEEGKTIEWKFPEFDMKVPVRVGKMEQDKLISYNWDGEGGADLHVEIELTSRGTNKTLVTITESSMPNNEAGIKWLKSNTAGWANFLDCLKAYLEYGINLREGGFDYMAENKEED